MLNLVHRKVRIANIKEVVKVIFSEEERRDGNVDTAVNLQ